MSASNYGRVVWIEENLVLKDEFHLRHIFGTSWQKHFISENLLERFPDMQHDYLIIFPERSVSELAPLIDKIDKMVFERKSKLYVVTKDGLVHFLWGFPQREVGISVEEKVEIFALVAEARLRAETAHKKALIKTLRGQFRELLSPMNGDASGRGSKSGWRLPWWSG